jgi:hypothetical protein
MGRLHRGLGDTLLWLAVMLGVLWLLVWIDVAPGPAAVDVRIPERLTLVAALSAGSLLVTGIPALAAWMMGLRWARVAALATAAAMLATNTGWNLVHDAAYLRWVSLVAGVGLVVYTLPQVWPPTLEGRGSASPLVARIGDGLLLLVVFAAAATIAYLGWNIGLVNRHPEDQHGLRLLVPGMAVATACLALGRHFFPAQPRSKAGPGAQGQDPA